MAYLHRTLCDVLKEMRQCYETRNFGYLPGLIEEAQSMGNRMEAKLEEYSSAGQDEAYIHQIYQETKNARKELNTIRAEIDLLQTKQEGI